MCSHFPYISFIHLVNLHHRKHSLSQSSVLFSKPRMSTAIAIPESSNVNAKEEAPLLAAPREGGGLRKGLAIMDFILRLGAIAASLGAAATMANSDQILPFFTQFFQFEASYDSFSTFQYVIIHSQTSPSSPGPNLHINKYDPILILLTKMQVFRCCNGIRGWVLSPISSPVCNNHCAPQRSRSKASPHYLGHCKLSNYCTY